MRRGRLSDFVKARARNDDVRANLRYDGRENNIFMSRNTRSIRTIKFDLQVIRGLILSSNFYFEIIRVIRGLNAGIKQDYFSQQGSV